MSWLPITRRWRACSTAGSAEECRCLLLPRGPLALRCAEKPIDHHARPKASTEGVERDGAELMPAEAERPGGARELVGQVRVRDHPVVGRAGDADAQPVEARERMLRELGHDARLHVAG